MSDERLAQALAVTNAVVWANHFAAPRLTPTELRSALNLYVGTPTSTRHWTRHGADEWLTYIGPHDLELAHRRLPRAAEEAEVMLERLHASGCIAEWNRESDCTWAVRIHAPRLQ